MLPAHIYTLIYTLYLSGLIILYMRMGSDTHWLVQQHE